MSESKIDWNALALPKVKAGQQPKTKDRATRGRQLKTTERSSKSEVRRLDRYCRFPRCGCSKKGYALAVAHLEHKGMGGNPKGDRSEIARMILVCAPRHRENPVSLDRGTVRLTPLTDAGTRGPCTWAVHVPSLKLKLASPWPGMQVEWMLLAIETAQHVFEPFTPEQLEVLNFLKGMKR
jgi:hypothetical protein